VARPEKKLETKRNLRFDLRLTSEEQKRLFQAAAARGLTVSDYIRLTVLESKPVLKQADSRRDALIKGLGELGKVGSNINQIARHMNTNRKAGQIPSVSPDIISGALYGVQTLSNHLLKLLSGGD